MNDILAIWRDTNARVASGNFTPKDWIRHMAREARIPGSDLGPALTLGARMGFADDAEQLERARDIAVALSRSAQLSAWDGPVVLLFNPDQPRDETGKWTDGGGSGGGGGADGQDARPGVAGQEARLRVRSKARWADDGGPPTPERASRGVLDNADASSLIRFEQSRAGSATKQNPNPKALGAANAVAEIAERDPGFGQRMAQDALINMRSQTMANEISMHLDRENLRDWIVIASMRDSVLAEINAEGRTAIWSQFSEDLKIVEPAATEIATAVQSVAWPTTPEDWARMEQGRPMSTVLETGDKPVADQAARESPVGKAIERRLAIEGSEKLLKEYRDSARAAYERDGTFEPSPERFLAAQTDPPIMEEERRMFTRETLGADVGLDTATWQVPPQRRDQLTEMGRREGESYFNDVGPEMYRRGMARSLVDGLLEDRPRTERVEALRAFDERYRDLEGAFLSKKDNSDSDSGSDIEAEDVVTSADGQSYYYRTVGENKVPTSLAFEALYTSGPNTKFSVTEVDTNRSRFGVNGDIVDASGRKVGEASREFNPDAAIPHVYHALYWLDEGVQGGGAGTEMLAKAADAYRALGPYEYIGVSPAWVGKHAWPNMGYDWTNEDGSVDTDKRDNSVNSFKHWLDSKAKERDPDALQAPMSNTNFEHAWNIADYKDEHEYTVRWFDRSGPKTFTGRAGKAFLLEVGLGGLRFHLDKDSPSAQRLEEQRAKKKGKKK